jgi:hypothetical protein
MTSPRPCTRPGPAAAKAAVRPHLVSQRSPRLTPYRQTIPPRTQWPKGRKAFSSRYKRNAAFRRIPPEEPCQHLQSSIPLLSRLWDGEHGKCSKQGARSWDTLHDA